MQAKIADLYAVYRAAEGEGGFCRAAIAAGRLEEELGDEPGTFMQVLHFCHLAEPAPEEATPEAGGRVYRGYFWHWVWGYLGRPSDGKLLREIAPYLDSAEPRMKTELDKVLQDFIERPELDRPPSFAAYRQLIADSGRAGEAVPDALVRRMFRVSPGQALLAYVRAEQPVPEERRRRLVWAEHTVAENLWKERHGFLELGRVEPAAAEQFQAISTDAAWWARLYAAEVMRQHPGFRRPELMERLAKDEHPLVREAASAPPKAAATQPARPAP